MIPISDDYCVQKNLLAFSGGVDSSALYNILKENNVSFDIAIVNYGLRESAKYEVEYAERLARKNGHSVFVLSVSLNGESNIEKKARDIRYDFFESLIDIHHYDNLITAHQLNDRLEWFLMKLSRGSGIESMMSMGRNYKKRTLNGVEYNIIRPLLDISREKIYEYLKKENITFFEDESNSGLDYERNRMRHNYSNRFLSEFETGVQKSFKEVEKDIKALPTATYKHIGAELYQIKKDSEYINIKTVDKILRDHFGYLVSQSTKNEIIRQNFSTIVANKFIVDSNEEFIFVVRAEKKVKMPQKFKDYCREHKIPAKIRVYIYKYNLLFEIF